MPPGFTMPRCRLAGAEAVAADSALAFARHSHERFGIGLIERGAQRSASGRGPVEAGAGDLITVNPGEVHDGAPLGGAGRAWRMLYMEPAVVAAAVATVTRGRRREAELPRPVLRPALCGPGPAATFRRLYRTATEGGTEGSTDALLREELLLALLAGLLREEGAPGEGARRPLPPGIARARALIEADPARPLSLAELAQAAGLGRFQLLRGFARATGLTPHAYLVQRRLDMARRLIAAGTPLAEASAAAGFADQSHLTRSFTRRYGLTPGAYAAAVR